MNQPASLHPIFDPTRRHDIVAYVEVVNSNINGNPDFGNLPRMDPATNVGLATGVSLKRKVRDNIMEHGKDWAKAVMGYLKPLGIPFSVQGLDVYIKSGKALGEVITQIKLEADQVATKKKDNTLEIARDICRNRFWDIRAFGGTLIGKGEKSNLGNFRGPWQIPIFKSVDPIQLINHSITRLVQAGSDEDGTFGDIGTTPYAIYEIHAYYSPADAEKTGFGIADMMLFYQALIYAYELNRAVGREEVNFLNMGVFTHQNKYGNALSKELVDSIQCSKKTTTPRCARDYRFVYPTQSELNKQFNQKITLTTFEEIRSLLSFI